MNYQVAIAQKTLAGFGDDERTATQKEIVKSVLLSMPYGLKHSHFILITEFISWMKYPAFSRFIQTALANYDKIADAKLAVMLDKAWGDLPNPESIRRITRKLTEDNTLLDKSIENRKNWQDDNGGKQ